MSTLVVPSGYDSSPGVNATTVFGPQGLSLPPPSFRYQQIYASSQIPSGTITAIAFRIVTTSLYGSPFSSSFSSVVFNIKINMSYSANTVGNASLTFASNVGSNVTTIVDNTSLSLSATGGNNINPFDVSFSCSFPYNPATGDLLIDIFMRNSPSCSAFMDAVDTTSNPLFHRIETTEDNTSNVNSATGAAKDYTGMITQFTMTGAAGIPLAATQMTPRGLALITPGLQMLNRY